MQPSTSLQVILSTLIAVPLSIAQNPSAPKPGEPKVEIRSATVPEATKGPKKLEIRSASAATSSPLAAKEQQVLQNLSNMNTEQVREMAELYGKLGNQEMTTRLVEELKKRNPKDKGAADILIKQQETAQEENDLPGPEDDPEAIRAYNLSKQGDHTQAAAVLMNLKAKKYRGKPFPHQQDLAYALLESGQEETAKAAFNELLRSKSYTAAEKEDAKRSLASLALEALHRKGHAALTARDAQRALQVANQLLLQNPNDPDGIALKAGAMVLTGNGQQAVNFLKELKSQSGAGPFLHQKSLADTYHEAGLLDDATAAYQEIIDNPRSDPSDRMEASAALTSIARDRMIDSAEHALHRGRIQEADLIVQQLETERPVHPDTLAVRAAVLNKQGRHAEAVSLLESLGAQNDQTFHSHFQLATAYLSSGRWQQAAEAFAIVENDIRSTNSDRFEAARLGREARSRFRPTAAAHYEAESGAEGKVWRSSHEASTGVIGDGNIFILRSSWDQVHLDNERSIVRAEADRYQAEIAYRKLISSGFFGEASVGVSDDDVVYGAKFGRYEGPGMGWELSFRGNDRATDSLQLEALNGRQNALSFSMSSHFSKRFYLDARAFIRGVSVQGHDLGYGWGMDMNIGYSLVEETMRRPELQISYFNELSYFHSKRLPTSFQSHHTRRGYVGNLGDELIDSRINRHGIILTLSKQLTHRVNAYVYGGASYEFENQELEGRLGAGLEAYLAPNASLNIGVDYTTSGNAGNRGSDVLSGTVGVKMSF